MFASEQGPRARSRNSSKAIATSVPSTRTAKGRKPRLRLVPQAAELPSDRGGLPPKIARYIATADLPSPCLIVDVDIVAHNFEELARSLPEARVFYAVKANPADEIVARLARLGSAFDTASIGEIDLCLSHGVSPDRLSFGNTIKKERDIAEAYGKGVRMFAFDSEPELEKIARVAPGSKVYCRVLMECEGAEWPLSRKFGCEPAMAVDLLARAKALGLDAYGISFHVGSQQTDLTQTRRSNSRSRCFASSRRVAWRCAWSTWAAASRRATAPTCPRSRPMARRSAKRWPAISATTSPK